MNKVQYALDGKWHKGSSEFVCHVYHSLRTTLLDWHASRKRTSMYTKPQQRMPTTELNTTQENSMKPNANMWTRLYIFLLFITSDTFSRAIYEFQHITTTSFSPHAYWLPLCVSDHIYFFFSPSQHLICLNETFYHVCAGCSTHLFNSLGWEGIAVRQLEHTMHMVSLNQAQ